MKDEVRPLRNKTLASLIDNMREEAQLLSWEMSETSLMANSQNSHLSNLQARLKVLAKKGGLELPLNQIEKNVISPTDELEEDTIKSQRDFRLDSLSDIDIALACVAGGLGVIIDFLVVKIPKTTKIVRDGESINQYGSPLTEWTRKIGFESDGKTSSWVKTLENWFRVNYDTSIITGERGFKPRTHRIFSLAHDPSPSGLLWAIKDMATSTFSYIDQSGKLKIIPANSVSPLKVLAAPIIWLGHLISDLFTKAGVPLPGSCFLRTLQLGSFGEKKRTIGQVIEYMYIEGYDVRHLATMSLVNACVETIIRIYNILTKPQIRKFARPSALIQADNVMNHHKLQKMRLCGLSVAAAGNLTKLAAYKWNPTALNAPVWLAFVRSAIAEFEYQTSQTKEVLDVMECRSEIEDDFNRIQRKLSAL